MAERSRDRAKPLTKSAFSRGRLAVGLIAVVLIGAGIAFGLRQLRSGPSLGRLVYATQDAVYERDLRTGERDRLAALPAGTAQAWPDPTGRWIGYLDRSGALWLLDLHSDARWRVADRLTVGQGWTPDGRFLAAELFSDRDLVAIDPGDRGSDLVVERFSGGQPAWIDTDHFVTAIGDDLVLIATEGPDAKKIGDDMIPLAASPDGSEVLISESAKAEQLLIATLEGGKIAGRRTVFRGEAARASVSDQGFVAFSGRHASETDGTWVLESRNEPPRRVTDRAAEQIAWSGDGSSLVLLIDGRISAVDLRDDRTVALSPAGTQVISIGVVP